MWEHLPAPTPATGYWCHRCQIHMRQHGGDLCPVCLDDQQREAAA